MAVITNIVEQRFLNKINNGDDFTLNTGDNAQNFVGNVAEPCKVTLIFDVKIEAFASSSDAWAFTNIDGTNGRFEKQIGNFIDEGFKVGDEFRQQNFFDASNTFVFQAQITSFEKGGEIMEFTVTAGALPSTGTVNPNDGIRRFFASGELKAFVYRFGLIENNETTNYINKVTGESQEYYGSQDAGLAPPVQGIPKGKFKSWVTGEVILSQSVTSTVEPRFVVNHEFIINPYYRQGEEDDIINGITRPEYANDNSLKYVWECSLREVISNPNFEIIASNEDTLGSTGDFGENFNGKENDYSINSITYTDIQTGQPVETLQIGKRTRVDIVVVSSKNNISVNVQRTGVFHSYLPTQEEYTNTILTDFKDNFIYDELYYSDGVLPISMGNGVIKTLATGIGGANTNIMGITIEIEFSLEQQLRLNDDSQFIIGVNIADPTISAANSNRVMLVADLRNYTSVSNVDELVNVNSFGFLQLGQQKGDVPSPSLEAWNEDGLLANVDFNIDLGKNAFINSLQMLLVAHNEGQNSFFELDSFDFPLGSGVVSNGVQEFNIEQEKGYPLGTADNFNEVSFKTGAPVGLFQAYEIFIGQKIAWEDWLRNLNADTVFFDNTKPNDNLNFLSSNYSRLEGYKVKMLMRIGLTGVDSLNKPITGISNQFSQEIVVSDYDEDKINTPLVWSAEFKTFTEDGIQELGLTDARLNLLSGQNTLFRIIWTNLIAPVTDITGILAVNRIQQENDSGKQIFELSNDGISPIFPTNPLKGVSGDYLAPYIQGGKVYCDVIIDASRIAANTAYKLSGKINL